VVQKVAKYALSNC